MGIRFKHDSYSLDLSHLVIVIISIIETVVGS